MFRHRVLRINPGVCESRWAFSAGTEFPAKIAEERRGTDDTAGVLSIEGAGLPAGGNVYGHTLGVGELKLAVLAFGQQLESDVPFGAARLG